METKQNLKVAVVKLSYITTLKAVGQFLDLLVLNHIILTKVNSVLLTKELCNQNTNTNSFNTRMNFLIYMKFQEYFVFQGSTRKLLKSVL